MGKIKYCWNCNAEVPYQEYEKINFIPMCPKCGVKYPEKPKDEAYLSMYQDEYLQDRSEKNYNQFFKLLHKVTFNVICHKLKATSSHECVDDILDKTQWTMEKLSRYYNEKPNFKITTSFVKYISQVILYPLYNKEDKERDEMEISIHSSKYKNSKGEDEKELLEYLSSDSDGGINKCNERLDYDNDRNYLVDESVKFISTVIDSLYESERNKKSKQCFRDSYFMAKFYEYFIKGELNNKNIEDIMNDMDYSLIEKFDKSKLLYKDILMKYANGE